jgi:hypothetical protein
MLNTIMNKRVSIIDLFQSNTPYMTKILKPKLHQKHASLAPPKYIIFSQSQLFPQELLPELKAVSIPKYQLNSDLSALSNFVVEKHKQAYQPLPILHKISSQPKRNSLVKINSTTIKKPSFHGMQYIIDKFKSRHMSVLSLNESNIPPQTKSIIQNNKKKLHFHYKLEKLDSGQMSGNKTQVDLTREKQNEKKELMCRIDKLTDVPIDIAAKEKEPARIIEDISPWEKKIGTSSSITPVDL